MERCGLLFVLSSSKVIL